jgi:hypothetical protein
VRAWRLAHRLDLLVPLCAIARKPSWPGGATTPRSLARQLELLAGGRADLLLLTGGHSSLNKAVALGFAQRTGPPVGVLKVPRVPESGAALRHEAEALGLVRDRHGDVSGIPRVLASEERRGIFVVEETFVGGTRVLESLTAENHERVALRVADLLARLVRHEAVVPARDAARAHLETARAELSVAESSKLEALVGAVHGLPVTCEHRDCSPWNLHVDPEGTLGLLDWEGAQINGLPLVDLLYYVGQAAMLLAGAGSERQAYAAMLQPGTPAESTLSRCIDRYVALTGLDREALRALRALCWLVHVPAARRRQADGRAEGITHPELFVHLARSELGRP